MEKSIFVLACEQHGNVLKYDADGLRLGNDIVRHFVLLLLFMDRYV